MTITAPQDKEPSHRTPVRWFGARLHAWALASLVVASAVFYGWNAAGSGYSDYYATAAKSMSVSWWAFFFGAFDPASTITLDKLSGFLIPQALSGRVFGFSAWSLALPQAIEGVVTVVVAYYIIRRWSGPVGGLIGAAAMASTPLLVSMFSHPMEDGMLTMCTTVAVAAWQRSIDTARLRWLLLSAVTIGVGFQAKMMQAWLVLPAMALVYLVVAKEPVRRRWRKIAAAGATAAAVSVSWMSAIALVPAATRPYIDGTTNNNIFSMVFGYNGVDRFISNLMPGALGSDPLAPVHSGGSVGLVPGMLGHTPIKLLLPAYATQIGWLYPLAAAGIVLGVIALRGTNPVLKADRELRAGILLSGSLLVTMVAVLSVMSLPHTAYLASLTFPLAALSAIGVRLLWQCARRRSGRLRYAPPVTVSVQTGWVLVLVAHYPGFTPWLILPIGVLGFGAAAVLALHATGFTAVPRLTRTAGVVALLAALLAPFTWSLSTVVPAYAGSANDAYAGPVYSAQAHHDPSRYGIGLDSNRDSDHTAALEARIFEYAKTHGSGAEFVLATDSWRSAAPMIMRGAQRVLPIGGYSSRVDAPRLSTISRLVHEHRLDFILLTGPTSKNAVHSSTIAKLHRWVETTCSRVPPHAYGAGPPPRFDRIPRDTLYACSR